MIFALAVGLVRIRMAQLTGLPLLLLLCSGQAEVARARIWRVTPDGKGDQPTIQAAVAAAADGDVVELITGVYHGPGNREVDLLGKAVTVRSAGGETADCVIDCAGDAWEPPHRGFVCQNGEDERTRLVGLTIINGQAVGEKSPAGSGGAILCRNAAPTISDCIFRGNRATSGGAIACEMAAPDIVRCYFTGNTAEHGGAVLVFRAAPRLLSCRFESNSAGDGGGVNCYEATPEIHGCWFDQNQAAQGGAVACTERAAPELVQCVLSRNFASLGGGIHAETSNAYLDQCTLVANCGGAGGGMHVSKESQFAVSNCIVAFSLQGGSIACDGTSGAQVSCSLVFGNGDGDWLGCLAGQEGQDGNLWANPRFVAGEQGDFSLRPDSPGRKARETCGSLGALGP